MKSHSLPLEVADDILKSCDDTKIVRATDETATLTRFPRTIPISAASSSPTLAIAGEESIGLFHFFIPFSSYFFISPPSVSV